jgi:asparagine synthetase B (glutamine-hydrolysing)
MLSPNELYSKFEFTENNHIKYWYDNDPSKIFREDDWQQTVSTVGHSVRPRLTFRGELIRTTKIISRKHKEPIAVFFSGGLDQLLWRVARQTAVPPWSGYLLYFLWVVDGPVMSRAQCM